MQDAFSLKKKDRKTRQNRILYRSLELCSRSLHAPNTCLFSIAALRVGSKAMPIKQARGKSVSKRPHRERPLNSCVFLLADERDERGAGIGNSSHRRTCTDCFRKFTSVTFTAFSLNIGGHKQVRYQFVKRFSLLDFAASFRSSMVWSVQ